MATKRVLELKTINLAEQKREIWTIVVNKLSETKISLADFCLEIGSLTQRVKDVLDLESVDETEIFSVVKEIFENLEVKVSAGGCNQRFLVVNLGPTVSANASTVIGFKCESRENHDS